MKYLFLDAESRSESDIKKEGAAKYVRDPSTRPFIWTWAFGRGDVQVWDGYNDHTIDSRFWSALSDPNIIKVAFNAPFDRGLITECWGIDTPVEQWRCAQVLAYSLGFKGTLDEVLEQIGFREGKDPAGKRLIQKFSVPNPRNYKERWYTAHTHPEDWQRFIDYAKKDTEVLRQLWEWCASYESMTDAHWAQWHLDQKINERGVPVDVDLCHAAKKMQRNAQATVKRRMQQITGLDNPLSNQQLRGWLEQYGVKTNSLAKDTIPHLTEDPDLRQVLDLYTKGNAKAAAKYDRFLQMRCEDDRVRGMFQFNGAGRTGRWAGRGVQLQNLKRGPRDEAQPEAVKLGDPQLIEMLYGDTLDTLSEAVRGAICSSDGRSLVVADLASIESRVIAWLTYCRSMTQVFEQGLDTYKDFATAVFGVPYDEVTKEMRTFAKPGVLGGGYMLGGPGLQRYADDMGIEMTRKEAFRHVRAFRTKYPEIPQFWEWVAAAVEWVVLTGEPLQGYRLDIRIVGEFLRIWMPSGRGIWYHKPMMKEKKIQYEDEDGNLRTMVKNSFHYMGFDQNTYKWKQISAHAGGLTENLVQALARDILAKQIGWADAQDITVIGHVHDEVIAEEPESNAQYQLEHLERIMSIAPSWAEGLLLGAEGYTAKRYKK